MILAIAILILPVLYSINYLALVVPPHELRTVSLGSVFWSHGSRAAQAGTCSVRSAELIYQDFGGELSYCYRWGGRRLARFFWPLEQVDRRVRPRT